MASRRVMAPESISTAEVTVVVGGDIAPILRNQPLFESGDGAALLGDLREVVTGADLAVANLEVPLIRTESPITKSGPVLGCPERCVRGVAALGFQWLNLANNHILDHGEEGLLNTIAVCRNSGLNVFGAGPNLADARTIRVATVKGHRIGLLGIADREFSIASDTRAGANPIDPIGLWYQLKDVAEYDMLVVLVHAGISGHPLPSPRLQRLCRYIVDLGADLVVCQHSHCPGAVEPYRDALIVYGQGNLLFDERPSPDGSWCEGFLVRAVFGDGQLTSHELVPYYQSKSGPGARRMPGRVARAFLTQVMERSRRLTSGEYVQREWARYCAANADGYYAWLRCGCFQNRIVRRICKELGIRWQRLSPNRQRTLGNMVRSEDHLEVLETILGESGEVGCTARRNDGRPA
jgi:poly-gamma-glutamate synthesis protein (capsule biosynthesis protein)